MTGPKTFSGKRFSVIYKERSAPYDNIDFSSLRAFKRCIVHNGFSRFLCSH